MYKLVLAEDEPAAMRYLTNIVEQKCEGFEIAGKAENGLEAFALLREQDADVLITDIKMPELSGIDLVARVKENMPHIFSVITSGYQDFEYAKGAVKSGVVDYILKPVRPALLKETLDAIKGKLDVFYEQKRIELLGKMLKGQRIDLSKQKKFLPYQAYKAAIIRENGPPARVGGRSGTETLASKTSEDKEDGFGDNIWLLAGRDEHEVILIAPADDTDKLTAAAKKVALSVQGYYTMLLSEQPMNTGSFSDLIAELYKTMGYSTVMGVNQIISGAQTPMANITALLDSTLINKIKFLMANNMPDELKNVLSNLLLHWEKEKYPLIAVEKALRQIVKAAETEARKQPTMQDINSDIFIDNLICETTSYEELFVTLWSWLENRFEDEGEGPGSAIFDSVEQYILHNLSEALSLQSICGVFKISQTYLSRLFRKYRNISVNEYITATRISKAKELMREQPKLSMKDIASIVGYSDPAYFSRVFFTATGMRPSEYIQKT